MIEENDVEMIDNPSSWPAFPILPLKRHGASDLGLLIAGQGATVFLVNMYDLKAGLDVRTLPQEKHEDAQAIVKAGWIVD